MGLIEIRGDRPLVDPKVRIGEARETQARLSALQKLPLTSEEGAKVNHYIETIEDLVRLVENQRQFS